MHVPRIVISGLSGGTGKTMLSLGLARAFVAQGLLVRAFKKGPDYIDAAWLAVAARATQANLDPFFTPGERLRALFIQGVTSCNLALIEGNRGLFDGLDINGSCSTAEVARILCSPVLLVLDCTKMTRTVAALVQGCLSFEQELSIGGVVLNRTGNERHQTMARRAVEELTGVPVLGVLPRRSPFILERHMGLAGLDENARADALLDELAAFVSTNVDMHRVLMLARSAPPLLPTPEAVREECFSSSMDVPFFSTLPENSKNVFRPVRKRSPRVGYVYDAALWFYYQENLRALANSGAELVPLTLLGATSWPEIHGLYLGGGLPELHAHALSANTAMRERVNRLSREGLPIYAECGGFMYLATALLLKEHSFPMAGVFPCEVEFCDKPQGLGYVEALVTGQNPFHPLGERFLGHEFHFSRCRITKESALPDISAMLTLTRGRGMHQRADGICLDGLFSANTFAAYTHIYAPAVPYWAPAFLTLCRKRLRG